MVRPRTEPDDRISTALRLPPDLHKEIQAAADERDVSVNWLIVRLLRDAIPRLVLVNEIRLTD